MKPKAFVLMPFAPEFDEIYVHLIQQGVNEAGFDVLRADDLLSQNNILKDILNSIITSELIVADLTGSNPNVYYELGIAHAFKKPVILLTQDIGELPFDLRSYRVISYGTHFVKMSEAKTELTSLAKEFLTGNVPFGSPVTDFVTLLPIPVVSQPNGDVVNEIDCESGILDYMIMFEDGMEIVGAIVTAVGEQLNITTSKVGEFTDTVNEQPNLSSKQRRDAVRVLADHIEKFGKFVKPKNVEYKYKVREVEQSLEFILSGKIPHDDNETLQNFLDVLEGVEISAFQGRTSFMGLVETMEAFPNFESQFDRAKKFMSQELREFISNIDQTISIISRARLAGKGLLEKNNPINSFPSNVRLDSETKESGDGAIVKQAVSQGC